ncbi:PREDICTED: protein MCM10 homolog [Rhagoletis zephyria]|uniref:protein MCM10 homolog n=1 Tax=Rhagoletis zephyria TaxID=28612 RepID=UPI0008114A33|nr:PREDICTED: protein MCM10 homolog [Rhagoletis zephyria]
MEKLEKDCIDEVDEELLALDAILAEVGNGHVSDVFENNKVEDLCTSDFDNVEFYLERKFTKYGDHASKHSSLDIYDGVLNKNKHVDGKTPQVEQTVFSFTDPIFGFRIMNPQISSILLTERMANRKAVTFNELPMYFLKDSTNDWVVAGVLLSKEMKHSSKSSKPFSVWKLSDLKRDLKIISICLFQNAHNELWKTPTGMCVAILNPSLIEKKLYSNDVATLSIESAKKVMILGKSKDLGQCKSHKKSGEPCKNFINLNEGDFCLFHVKRAYRKTDWTAENVKRYRNVADANLLGKLHQRDKKIMNSLTTENISLKSVDFKRDMTLASGRRFISKVASTVETNTKQRLLDLERLKTLCSPMNISKKLSTATKGNLRFAGITNFKFFIWAAVFLIFCFR